MSIVAHGYGIAAVGMPNLLFFNVIWGCLVRAIPQIHGLWGYSIATTGGLVIVGMGIVRAMGQLRFGRRLRRACCSQVWRGRCQLAQMPIPAKPMKMTLEAL